MENENNEVYEDTGYTEEGIPTTSHSAWYALEDMVDEKVKEVKNMPYGEDDMNAVEWVVSQVLPYFNGAYDEQTIRELILTRFQ